VHFDYLLSEDRGTAMLLVIHTPVLLMGAGLLGSTGRLGQHEYGRLASDDMSFVMDMDKATSMGYWYISRRNDNEYD
jgi:hypothetical protein